MLHHYPSTNNYGDSGNELTDGEIANINNAYGKTVGGFQRCNGAFRQNYG